MPDSIRLYLRYLGISVRSQMQYPASFWMYSIGQFFATVIEFFGILVLFERFGSLRGWSLPEVALFYGVVNVAFSLSDAFARGFDQFAPMVKRGDFDRLLLRPRGTAFQVAGQQLLLTRVGRLIQGLVILVWATGALGVAWTAPKVALLLGMILGGACIFYALFVLQATLSFWTIETLEIMNTVTYGGTETAQFPLTIYRRWFRNFFTFVVPLACMNYLPASILLDRPGPPGVPRILLGLMPAIGVVFLLVSLRVWEVGVRHYHSTGS
jgi:ABC-2 type transport system permease protein